VLVDPALADLEQGCDLRDGHEFIGVGGRAVTTVHIDDGG
jgi:hypothetical protein